MDEETQARPERSAVISDDDRYRYRLDRRFPVGEGKGGVTFVMLNPSTADAEKDDPTIRKCVGFARRWGKNRVYVVNLFAYRATMPGDLLQAHRSGIDVVGPENEFYVQGAVGGSDLVVAAWGRNVEPWKWSREHVAKLVGGYRDMRCLGTTVGGSPVHPLMIPYDRKLIPFSL